MAMAECNSFPRCYRSQYRRLPSFSACLQRSTTCYLNSGVYLGGLRELAQLLPPWENEMERFANQTGSVERNEDQSALHRLYLQGGRAPAPPMPTLEIDSDNKLFLSLYSCKGSNSMWKASGRAGSVFRARAHPQGP